MKCVGRCVVGVGMLAAALAAGPSTAGAALAGASPVTVSATRVELQFQGQTYSFSGISGISSEVEPNEYIYANPQGTLVHTKQFGQTKPPEVTLQRGFDNSTALFAWHKAVRNGNPNARQNVTLNLVSAGSGSNPDGVLDSYELINAWPKKLAIAGAKAGGSSTLLESVTLVMDKIVTAPSGQSSVGFTPSSRPGTVHLAAGVPNPTTPHGTPAVLDGAACASNTACTAVGQEKVKGRLRPLVERWNGSVWSLQTAPLPAGAAGAYLDGVACPSATSCTAVGAWRGAAGAIHALVETWDGTAWTTQTAGDVSGAPSTVLSGVSCSSASSCEAVGAASGRNATLAVAEAWNGSAWQLQTVPRPLLYGPYDTHFAGVSCTSSTACMAVGGNGTQPFAASFNGLAWTLAPPALPAGATGGTLNSVSCAAAGTCTAVGSGSPAAGGQLALAESWSAGSWTVQPLPHPKGTGGSNLNGVACVAVDACTAVGGIVNAQLGRKLLIERWNGTAWRKLPSPNPGGEAKTAFHAVACPASGSCVGVGGASQPSETAIMQLLDET